MSAPTGRPGPTVDLTGNRSIDIPLTPDVIVPSAAAE